MLSRPFLLLVALLASARATLGQPAAAPAGFVHVKTLGGIAEYRLVANDLSVLLLEDHSAPVLTFMVTYRVGSRNEVTGTTGATHLLEHLMFKGSRNFHHGIGKGFDTLMDRVGGINNATTWLDRTNYYENLPSDHLELAVQLEADRMRNLLLREDDRQPEMTVVRNEFEQHENDPAAALDKEVVAAAFIAHPYRHPTIGWRSDIEKVSIEKLREFYDTFYWPDNATISVIGDFRSDAALRLIEKYFGGIARAPKPIPEVYTEEPAQTGPRRVVVKRPGEVGAVQIAYKATHARHEDHAPLEVLAGILGEGKTSRLYRALIDTSLAINADAANSFTRDNFLFSTRALLVPTVTHEQAEKSLRDEVEKVKRDGVSPDEVSRAINKLLAGIAYQRDGSFAIAGHLNEAIAVGDWTLYFTLLDKIRAVTAEDVQRVAQKYLNDDQSTTGWFIPLSESPAEAPGTVLRHDGEHATGSPSLPARRPHFYRDPRRDSDTPAAPRAALQRDAAPALSPGGATGDTALIAPRVRRRTIANVDVLTLRTSIKDVVTIRGVIGAGDAYNPPENSALADLAGGMLDKGTERHDKFALAALLEQTGATIGFSTGTHTLSFTAKCLRSDLPQVLGLLAEQLRTPRFDPEEFDKLKKQIAGRFRRALEDPDFRASSTLSRALFPVGHPNRPPEDEKYLADIERATLEQVKAFHAAHYGPAAARLVAVGDIDDPAIDRVLAEAFAGWQGGKPIPNHPKAPRLTAARTLRVEMPGKSSVSVAIGQPSGLRYNDPDHLALNMATTVLGGGFFSARLLATIRNREGLTYHVGAQLGADTYADGSWTIEGSFAPELLERGLAATRRELTRFHAEGISAEELADFKVALTGTYKVALATTEGLASMLLTTLQRGFGPEWVDEYPRRVQALTLEEVNAAIKKVVAPDSMITVLAGTLPRTDAAK